eukprot:6025405-Lingulodinium_polyedra.AAC.1
MASPCGGGCCWCACCACCWRRGERPRPFAPGESVRPVPASGGGAAFASCWPWAANCPAGG